MFNLNHCVMKKITIVILIFAFIAVFSCEKKTDPGDLQNHLVRSFMDSREFCKNELLFNSYGSIGEGKIETLNDGTDMVQYLMIPIMEAGKITAYIQAVDLQRECLPNKERWAMNLVDLRNFDNTSLTGNVRMYDLNYDAFMHSEMTVSDNKILSWSCSDLPQITALKYDVASKGKFAQFFACYRETRAWYDSNDYVNFICDWANVSCAASASAYCLWQAAYYETR
jgi:hypothetical protein